jgi:hypothetical protein
VSVQKNVTFRYSRCLCLPASLLAARDDAILLVAGSDSFVSELLSKIWQDVRVLWEWESKES